jgi:hypothetical protein
MCFSKEIIVRGKHLKGYVISILALTALLVSLISVGAVSAKGSRAANSSTPQFAPTGNLDCNGYSNIQQPLKVGQICTDFKGYDGGRGEDNGHYIGHDEPANQFNSQVPGSGNNVRYTLTLPRERPLPASQTFENQIAFWFSMALCDPNSYPQNPCIPNSDSNTSATFDPTSAGSAFLEMQFYPPGFAPFISAISCDTKHWCASLHINSLECTAGFAVCNPNCIEPTNFAFIQMDGVPTGPPGPFTANAASVTPNAQTLLMNQGDTLRVTINDTPGDTNGGVTTQIDDLSTHKSGFMVASASNGFQSLDVNTCAPTNFSFHPEFSTARFGNFVPWAALQANVGFASEIGHFTPGVNGDNDADDAPCFPASPDRIIAGCLNFATGGDTDFDGTSYQAVWPDGTRNNATSLSFTAPLSAPYGSSSYKSKYPILQLETDALASESTCTPSGAGCTVPPPGANFYPFYSVGGGGKNCAFLFGNNTRGVNDLGKDAQYGTPNIPWFFGTASGGPQVNPCSDKAV